MHLPDEVDRSGCVRTVQMSGLSEAVARIRADIELCGGQGLDADPDLLSDQRLLTEAARVRGIRSPDFVVGPIMGCVDRIDSETFERFVRKLLPGN